MSNVLSSCLATNYPQNICIHHLFEASVEFSPDAVAAVFEGEQLTYRELNHRANCLAHHLQALGVEPEVLVGICTKRSIEMLVGMLGILKAGGAYLPLDPAYPSERLAFMLEDAEVSILLTQQHLIEQLPIKEGVLVVGLEQQRHNRPSDSTAQQIQDRENNPLSRVTTDNLAYVIYTSGSTGKPKGVMVQHGSLLNLVQWHQQAFAVCATDRVTQMAGVGFDACAWEIWPYLTAGASIYFPDESTRLKPEQLQQWLISQAITLSFLPTPLCEEILRLDWPVQVALRTLLTGGDKLNRYPQSGHPFEVVNNYGPTENTVVTTSGQVPVREEASQLPTIGHPIDNIQVYILDEQLFPVPMGVTGELCISGDGLARGYLNRPELTAHKFIPNPLSEQPGSRLYKTGDLARYLPDGNIEYCDRIDNQVKIRGHRIELGEIEATLAQHPGIFQNVVIVQEARLSDQCLVAYVVPDQEQVPTSSQLRHFLEAQLPNYMIPAAFVMLDSLPLTPNGKVDRRALPAPDGLQRTQDVDFVAPHTLKEKVIATIWAEVLGFEVGIEDNFFEIGGHSLLAVQILSRIRSSLQVELPLSTFYDCPTISGLVKVYETFSQQEPELLTPPIQPIPQKYNLPLSFTQEQLWFFSELYPERPIYNETLAIHIKENINPAFLEQSIAFLIQRYEILRTSFVVVDEKPLQRIHPSASFHLSVIDLRDLTEAERETKALELATEDLKKSFNLGQCPLLRATLIQLEDKFYKLFIAVHHLLVDGISIYNIFLPELKALYAAFSQGKSSPLPEPTLQYADFAFWQRQEWQEDVFSTQLLYWKQKLASLPILKLPTDRSRPTKASFQGARQCLALSKSLTDKLKTLSRQESVTLFVTLVAAVKTLLYRYSGQQDIVLGTVTAGRNRSELERVMGNFLNTLVLRTDLANNPRALLQTTLSNSDPPKSPLKRGTLTEFSPLFKGGRGGSPGLQTCLSFRQLLKRVQKVTLEAYTHQDVPFEKVVAALQPDRRAGENPIFQVAFVLEPPLLELDPMSGRSQRRNKNPSPLQPTTYNLPPTLWTLSQLDVHSGTAKFDLTFELDERPEGIIGRIEYSTDLFDDATISRMIGHFQTMLAGIVANPDERISELPLLTDAEQHQLLVEWTDTRTEYSQDKCIHQLFEACVEQTPDAVAVIFEDKQLTYRELNAKANQLAHDLKSLGVGPEVLVGICTERSIEMVVGMLGILKAGGAYLPLDPAYPIDRLGFMLEDACVSILLTQQHLVDQLPSLEGLTAVYLDERSLNSPSDSAAQHAQDRETNPHPDITTDNLAYVIYTSGSTGKPKGVMVQHGSLLNLVQWHQQAFGVCAEDRVTQMAGIAFDACAWEIWPYLAAGASIYFPDESTRLKPEQLQQWLISQAITISFLPTPLGEEILRLDWPVQVALRTLLTGGDKLNRYPQSGHPFEVVNNYGPTENTVVTTSGQVPVREKASQLPAIGGPINNTQVYILDEQLLPVPIGVKGELYIGGDGLARGYLNRSDLTAQQFIPNPLSEQPGSRLYKTGDLARYLPDGNIEYLGRIDNQVKIRGHRIELGEIEAVVNSHPQVLQAVVIVREDVVSSQRLVAYIVGPKQNAPTHSDLRRFLKEKLPEYMVPGAFMMLDALPVTPNGKIDRQALPAPVGWLERSDSFVAPRTPTEQTVANIFAEVLEIKQVGVWDNFFELGGHSLLATQLISRVRLTFAVNLPLHSLFEDPTVAGMAECIETISWTASHLQANKTPVNDREEVEI